jgi:hypothetical protein
MSRVTAGGSLDAVWEEDETRGHHCGTRDVGHYREAARRRRAQPRASTFAGEGARGSADLPLLRPPWVAASCCCSVRGLRRKGERKKKRRADWIPRRIPCSGGSCQWWPVAMGATAAVRLRKPGGEKERNALGFSLGAGHRSFVPARMKVGRPIRSGGQQHSWPAGRQDQAAQKPLSRPRPRLWPGHGECDWAGSFSRQSGLSRALPSCWADYSRERKQAFGPKIEEFLRNFSLFYFPEAVLYHFESNMN